MFQIKTKKLLGPLMLDNFAFCSPFLVRSLVDIVLIDCNRYKSKDKFLVVDFKTLFVVFFHRANCKAGTLMYNCMYNCKAL